MRPRHFRQLISNWFLRFLAPPKRTAKVEQIEKLIKDLSPKELEAVEYLKWIRREALEGYSERLRIENRNPHPSTGGLESTIESFIQFLDGYRRLKFYL